MRMFFLLLALLVAATDVAAQNRGLPRGNEARGNEALAQDDIKPLGSVLQGLRGRGNGRLLDANLDRAGGRAVYVIRMLEQDGRVRTLTVDAKSGQVINDRGR